MNKVQIIAAVACTSGALTLSAVAQTDFSRFSVRGGTIRTQTPSSVGHLWSFYPEIEVGGHFLRPFLSWSASWGYWSDGINEALPVADMVTYSQNGHIISARIGFRPQLLDNYWPIPLTIFAGVAEQFSKTTYVGGFGLSGNRGENSSDQQTMAFFGGGLYYPLTSYMILEAEALQFAAIGEGPDANAQKNRRAFILGVAVEF